LDDAQISYTKFLILLLTVAPTCAAHWIGSQVKGDYRRADEYYSRAILADPDDGELLSEYAKLVWEVHRDEDRASSYFERAAKASPQNSHVLAAHAAFLWDTDDEEGGADALSYAAFAQPAHSSLASATATT
jgi:Tfp pilus assembly protein PilF